MRSNCRYEQDKSTGMAITYTCGDVMLVFDRADPVRKARYVTTLHLIESKVVCARYTQNSNGQTVCAESRTETVYRDARRSGTLRVQRVDDA